MRTTSQRSVGRRHEVDDADGAAVTDELGLQDQRVAAVALASLAHRHGRPQRPAAVLVVADERREARVGVEARGAEPVERALRETSAAVRRLPMSP